MRIFIQTLTQTSHLDLVPPGLYVLLHQLLEHDLLLVRADVRLLALPAHQVTLHPVLHPTKLLPDPLGDLGQQRAGLPPGPREAGPGLHPAAGGHQQQEQHAELGTGGQWPGEDSGQQDHLICITALRHRGQQRRKMHERLF